MVCFGNICLNTLHKGDNDYNNNVGVGGVLIQFISTCEEIVHLIASFQFSKKLKKNKSVQGVWLQEITW